jgi:hypothetical protein
MVAFDVGDGTDTKRFPGGSRSPECRQAAEERAIDRSVAHGTRAISIGNRDRSLLCS